ncbi:glycine-rich domain-containing protein-like [Vibrio parahaemolyticus]|nr:glycine-rich domain-containing protein-like [Vibrio parahaemolyticus]
MNVIQIQLPSEVNTDKNRQFARAVISLDLGAIKYKLMYPDDGEGWTQKRLDVIEARYKVFLLLIGLYPDRSIVPTKDIDSFWHAHILDTQKYREDCDYLFGKFIDHFPYFGLRGEEDRRKLNDTFEKSMELYRVFLPEIGAEELPRACGAGCGNSLCEPIHCKSNACKVSFLKLKEERPTLGNEFVKLEMAEK